MNLGRLLFSPEGRIGQREFWIAVLILFAAGVLLHAVAVVGTGIWLLSTYCWVCVFAKRLHDTGRSGFAQVWLYLLDFVLIAVLAVGGVGSIIAGTIASQTHPGGWGLVIGGVGLVLLALLAWGLVRLAFVLWLGLSAGQPGENRYGPVPAP